MVAGPAGVAFAWLLARPDGPDPSAVVRVFADILGATVLGLCTLDLLQRGERRRAVPRSRLWRPLAVAAALWALTEVVLLVAAAAETAETAAGTLTPGEFGRFVGEISVGRLGAAAIVCTAAIAVTAAMAYRRDAEWSPAPIAAVAALALLARPVTGHMSAQALGSLLVAAHTLTAAVWLGPLLAMALLLRGRGAWATVLPRYSDLAWKCVAVLTVTGVADAAVALGGIGALVDTGYGRVLLAKALCLAGLIALGWWWRRHWVPAATTHRSPESDSLRNAAVEVTALAFVFGLAAALATTG
ncbi:copper resistance D family protein [Rhodococcus sp. NPDC003318]|uniref:copper resistance D family protein n=1 Tax=Rhodococcus sp. NPDC003318 TaxID=3364503 RepID=UPI0036B27AA1